MKSLQLFVLSWLVWDAMAIGLRFGEATPAVGAAAVAILVAWWTRRIDLEAKVGRSMALGILAIIPADLCFILFDTTFIDRTSHNLAPFELVFATGLGAIIVVGGAAALRLVIPAKQSARHWPAVVAVMCGLLLVAAFRTAEMREQPVPPARHADRAQSDEPRRRLSAGEVRELLSSGIEVGEILLPSGAWEGSRGTRYRARYRADGRLTYTPEGEESLELVWSVRPSGALCRGTEDDTRCRFVEMRGTGDYLAVGNRSGAHRYAFSVEPDAASAP
jgi:hypothetical protein